MARTRSVVPHSVVPRRLRSMLAERRLARSRIVACDLDGTLLNGDVMVGAETARLVRRIVALGIEFVFITARHHFAAEIFADELHLDQTIISLDGAMTMRPHDASPSSTIPLDRLIVREATAAAFTRRDVDCALVVDSGILQSSAGMIIPGRHVHWNIDVARIEAPPDDRPVLELIVSGTFHGVNAVHDEVRARLKGAGVRSRLYESDSHGDLWYLELRSVDACKLRALEAYVATRGVGLREVIAIGDARNDLDFCEKSGYTVAVNNAVDRLKEMADFVTAKGCTEEGINEFLEHLLAVRQA